MIVNCSCGAKLKISDEKITAAGVKIKCPKCGNPHLVHKTPPATPAPPTDGPSLPWFASSAPSAVKPLVLIAHDSTVVADMIVQVVSEAGYDTAHALDGLEALKKATELKPQVMIVDVGLTGIYGFELCERLKGDLDTRDIRIILLSSVYGLTAYKRSPSTLYGADDYIEKHHIPDKLVSKIERLLTGQPLASPQFPAVPEPGEAVHDRTETEKAGRKASPLISRKGMMIAADSAGETGKSPETSPSPSVGEREKSPALPAFPDVLPKTPVTLEEGRKRTIAPLTPVADAHSPAAEEARPVTAPSAVKALPVSMRSEFAETALQNESVRLDASFFEQEEYDAPAGTGQKSAAAPEEIEKARRFARLIVSDIALYNQDVVAEGLMSGTLFELLQDDITEGRSLYDKRVPETVKRTKDYYQEAFDDFIAAKKKQR